MKKKVAQVVALVSTVGLLAITCWANETTHISGVIDGKEYTLPFRLEELLENGWIISENQAFNEVPETLESMNAYTCTLEKEDAEHEFLDTWICYKEEGTLTDISQAEVYATRAVAEELGEFTILDGIDLKTLTLAEMDQMIEGEKVEAAITDWGSQYFYFLNMNEDLTNALMISFPYEEDKSMSLVNCVWLIERSYIEDCEEHYNGVLLPEGVLPYF